LAILENNLIKNVADIKKWLNTVSISSKAVWGGAVKIRMRT